jgi:AcrR family transcriptional regulator
MKIGQKIRKKAKYHHGDLRAQLVEATRILVEEKGPDRFSVSEACRVAGVSTAAPYRHFKDKEEMLMAVTADGLERQFALMQEMVQGHPKHSIARIVAMGRAYIEFARAEPAVFRLMFGATRDHKSYKDLMDQGPLTFEFVEQEVADFMHKDAIDDDVGRRAFLLWTFVHGLSFLLIDEKVELSGLVMDLDALLLDIGQRVLIDAVPA